MARFAQFRGLGMSCGFGSSWAGAVVTSRIVAGQSRYRRVVEQDLQPITSIVTNIAWLAGGNMVGAFTTCFRAVMAIFASIRRLGVIDGNSKGSPAWPGGMTKLAAIGRERVRIGLIGSISSRVAAITTISGLLVIERQ